MRTLTSVLLLISVSALDAEDSAVILSPRNLESPFCYVAGGSRSWPVFRDELEPQDQLTLTARRDDRVIRYLPDQGPLELFVNRYIDDLADNRGSRFRGPRSFVYEAQETFRAADRSAARKRREEIIRYLLSHKDNIGEVLLYEAADWTYYLPLSEPDIHGHLFLHDCDDKP